MPVEDYYGRLLTKSSIPLALSDVVMSLPSFFEKHGKWYCQRCGTVLGKETQLPAGDYYCRFCLVFGRNRTGQPLYYVPQCSFPKCQPLVWSGDLTPFQAEVSETLLNALMQKQNTLVHAVTGSGKTEMIYQVVAKVLEEGGSVALVSPRIDVCNELYQRFSRDFTCPIMLLHGEISTYNRTPLLVATVHQLFKFYQAFDLIIVDEVDAFPYVDNPQLYRAVENALKPSGVTFYLTATSTDQLDREVRLGRLKVAHLSRRFHGNPLVVPQTRWLSGLLTCLGRSQLPKRLIDELRIQRQTGYPLLLFFPNIRLGLRFTEILQQYFPDEKIGFVSSHTEKREELVQSFRKNELQILVSTTILERGVTFPCVDVFVLWANHKLYSRSSLVQISGRVGRSLERPTGKLLFFHDGLTRAIKKAISEIKMMNKKGGFDELSHLSNCS